MIKISHRVDSDYPIPHNPRIFLLLPTVLFIVEGSGFNKYMSVIIILLIASITVAGLFLVAFLWSVRSGQFEDDISPASRILFDDKPPSSP